MARDSNPQRPADDAAYEREHDGRRTPDWTADEGEPDVEPFLKGSPEEQEPEHGYGYE